MLLNDAPGVLGSEGQQSAPERAEAAFTQQLRAGGKEAGAPYAREDVAGIQGEAFSSPALGLGQHLPLPFADPRVSSRVSRGSPFRSLPRVRPWAGTSLTQGGRVLIPSVSPLQAAVLRDRVGEGRSKTQERFPLYSSRSLVPASPPLPTPRSYPQQSSTLFFMGTNTSRGEPSMPQTGHFSARRSGGSSNEPSPAGSVRQVPLRRELRKERGQITRGRSLRCPQSQRA